MDDDRIKGTVNTAEGKLKKAAGQITDDAGLEAEGAAGELAGRAQQAVGRAKDAARDYLDTAADRAEELGAAANRTWERGRSYVEDRLDLDGRELVERGRGASTARATLRSGTLTAALS